VKPHDLDDRAPIEADDKLLARVHARSRSFRRRRTTQRLASVTTGLVVLALASGIAWTRLDATTGRGVRPAPSATSTTTRVVPALTETEIMGKWRPASIAGYDGPLTVQYLSFDGRGSWSGGDGCNELSGTYRLDENGVRFGREVLSTARGCGAGTAIADFGPIERAARSDVHGDQLTFFDSAGQEIARFVRARVTARIVLPSTTMIAGSTMPAKVVVENNTGHEIHETKCGSFFQIGLQNGEIKFDGIWPQCAEPFTIPTGESTYAVTVSAAYQTCSASGALGTPPCLRTGMPPLPPGQYKAALFQSSPVVTAPLPIDVKVEAAP